MLRCAMIEVVNIVLATNGLQQDKSYGNLCPPPCPARLRTALGKTALKAAISAAVVGGVLGAGQAQAIVITVGGKLYDITTFTGTYAANASKFNLPSAGGVMPWWNDQAPGRLAFAAALNTALGLPNPVAGVFSTRGPGSPYFAFQLNTTNSPCGSPTSCVGSSLWEVPVSGTPGTATINVFSSDSYVWAQGIEVTPTPGPLPLLGALAAFGTSRKLRKRIKDSKAIGSSITIG